jgi:hypothetical protein
MLHKDYHRKGTTASRKVTLTLTFRAIGKVRDSRQSVTTWAEEDIVGIGYEATTSEDLESSVCPVVRSKCVNERERYNYL